MLVTIDRFGGLEIYAPPILPTEGMELETFPNLAYDLDHTGDQCKSDMFIRQRPGTTQD